MKSYCDWFGFEKKNGHLQISDEYYRVVLFDSVENVRPVALVERDIVILQIAEYLVTLGLVLWVRQDGLMNENFN
jgi:hypothetical protein